MNVVILAVIAWWIAEGSHLPQDFKWWFKIKRLYVLDCPKCLGFWLGLFCDLRLSTMELNVFYDLNPIRAVLVSAVCIVISRLYNKI